MNEGPAHGMLYGGKPSPENRAVTRSTLRKMRPQDMEAVLGILRKWNMAPVSASVDLPDPERDHIELDNTFVAELDGRVVGVASYLLLDACRAETASLAVDPEFVCCGIGGLLQQARLDEMRARGVRHVRTESDRPDVIRWYRDSFGYRVTGSNPKKHAFGRTDCDHWTVLELDLG